MLYTPADIAKNAPVTPAGPPIPLPTAQALVCGQKLRCKAKGLLNVNMQLDCSQARNLILENLVQEIIMLFLARWFLTRVYYQRSKTNDAAFAISIKPSKGAATSARSG
jgi:hypothetical protein